MKRGSGTSPALTNNSPALTNNSPATVPTLPGNLSCSITNIGLDFESLKESAQQLQHLFVVGSSRSGTNDVDSIHVTTAGSGSLYTDDIQKNLFGSPQLHQCTTNDAERSNVNAREGETRD
jgi:calcineurin-binding protein cabin-1